jgi:hypothetical protein
MNNYHDFESAHSFKMPVTTYQPTKHNFLQDAGLKKDKITLPTYVCRFRKNTAPYCVSWKFLKIAVNCSFSSIM